MKINSLLTEIAIFLLILLFLVLPPVFGGASPVIFQWTFPLSQLLLALVALCIFLFYHKKRNTKVNVFGFRIFFTLGLLFVSYLLLNFISLLFHYTAPESVDVPRPSTFTSWLFCILNFIFAAFYEEVVYRFYLTDSLTDLLTKISPIFESKITLVVCEIITAILFALAHGYMGIFAIINALIAHFVLRYTYKKSNSIIPGFIAHFIYNMISVILL